MRPPRRRALQAAALFVFVVLATGFVLSRFASLGEAWRLGAQFPAWALALALALQALRFLADGRLVGCAARLDGERVSTGLGAELFVAGSSAGLLFGGAALMIAACYRWLRDRGVGIGAASLASWLPTALDNLAVALVSVVGLVHFFIHFRSSPPVVLSSLSTAALLLVVLALAGWAVHARERAAPRLAAACARVARRLRRPVDEAQVRAELRRVLAAATTLGGGRYRGPLFWALAATALDALSLRVIFAAAHEPIRAIVLLTGFGVPQLVGRVVPVPGGVGIVEAGVVATFVALGVGHAVAVAVVLAYRLVSFWLPSVLGFALVLHLERPLCGAGGARRAGPRPS